MPHAIASGPDGTRALNISSPAGFAELIARTATPLHLATEATALDVELFNAVGAEMGDIILGPPGAPHRPASRAPGTPLRSGLGQEGETGSHRSRPLRPPTRTYGRKVIAVTPCRA